MRAKNSEGHLSKGEATKGRILEVAEKVFAEVGYSATKLDSIAELAGVKRSTVLHYFKTKQDLYDRVEASIFDGLQAALQQKLVGLSDPLERLLALFDCWLDCHVARPTGARIILRNNADDGPGNHNPVKFSESAMTNAEQIIQEGQAAGIFQPHKPARIVTLAGGAILLYICNSNQLGEQRNYDPADPIEIENFRRLIHQIVRSVMLI